VAPGPLVAQEEAADGGPQPLLDLELGYGQTDNLGRDASNVRSAITTLGLIFGGAAARPRLDGRLVGDVDWLHYGAEAVQDDTEVVGSIDGAMSVEAVPEIFLWDFQYNYGQLRTDPLAPIGPDNRETAKVATTGPAITVPLGPRNSLEFGAQVSQRNYEASTQLDSEVQATSIGFTHDVDSVTAVNLSLDDRETDYDNGLQAYEYQSITIGYAREFASGGVELSLGRAEMDVSGTTEPATIGNFAWQRGIAARSRLRLWVSQDYTDAGQLFRLGGLPATSQVPLSTVPESGAEDAEATGSEMLDTTDSRSTDVVLTDDPSLRSSIGLQLSLVGRLSNIGLSFEIAENNFVTNNSLDSDLTVLSLSLGHDFGGSWRLELGIRATDEDFTTRNVENEDRYGRLALTHAVGRQSRLSIAVRGNRRDAGVNPYDENEYTVSFGHEFTR
jgi:hypothetical protein